MKNTVLWSALFTLIGTQVCAEQTPAPQAPAAPTNTSAPPASPASEPMVMQPVAPQPQQPNQAIPTAPVTAPAPAPVINCDYKIPPQVKTVDQALVLTWSQNAVKQAFSFDPASLDAQMQKLQACFTEQGWTGFSTALQKSGNIQAIKAQQLTVTSQIEGMTLVNEAKDNQWKLTVPVMVIYQNEKEKVSQLLSVDLTVNRKPNGDLGITQMIAAPRGTVSTKKPAQEEPANLGNQPPLGKPQ
ncbi:DotI/IcmL family type IV secretion protein [Legionella drancourtii]|uniref:IcmL-like protein n=1 Tax=Legionella drancourtii LLAP12 TaxID=658187 RepID=G9ENW0_9GAMM|nr:DotI/IcmL family type IV secretion protein [Legionella drancourtii]EHL31032.1 hypothetical protein LDG_6939 [Legionella drancourtii LLAP12]